MRGSRQRTTPRSETATEVGGAPCRVATALSLLLLKLEAGGPVDRLDIIGLVDAQRELAGAP